MSNKKIAIIDLGTNTFHLLIADITGVDFEVLVRERVAVKIGKDGISRGLITAEAQQRAINALKKFKETIDLHQISEIYATATSAIRNAKNGQKLAAKIKDETDINIKIISGDAEAEYIYYGVKTALSIGERTSLIMDIGGGSVEFIICNQTNIFWKQSFEIGAQRLLDLFHYHDPILKEEIIKLDDLLEKKLNPLFVAAEKYKPEVLIGSSGTFDTLAEIYSLRNKLSRASEAYESPLPIDDYYAIYEDIIHKTREERMHIPGMIEMRVEMIVVACALITFVLEKLSIKEIRISAFSLKEGVLYSIVNSLQKNLNLKD